MTLQRPESLREGAQRDAGVFGSNGRSGEGEAILAAAIHPTGLLNGCGACCSNLILLKLSSKKHKKK